MGNFTNSEDPDEMRHNQKIATACLTGHMLSVSRSINNLLEIQSMLMFNLYWATVSLKITDTYSGYAGECTL